jgi:uncharacterized protein YfkK (UPF0435 family)
MKGMGEITNLLGELSSLEKQQENLTQKIQEFNNKIIETAARTYPISVYIERCTQIFENEENDSYLDDSDTLRYIYNIINKAEVKIEEIRWVEYHPRRYTIVLNTYDKYAPGYQFDLTLSPGFKTLKEAQKWVKLLGFKEVP